MSAHRRAPRKRPALRRTLTAAVLAVASGSGLLVAAGPATAAGPWFVAPGGNNGATCLSAGAPCATVTGVLAKAGFVSGDTINVAPGTYTDKPLFQTKTASVVGSGAGVVFSGTNTTYAIGVVLPAATTLNLTNVTLTAGKNSNGLGGGLAIGGGKVNATNVTLSGNNASNVGGGAYVGAGTVLTMTGGAVSGNTSTNQAGGIYSAGTTVLTNTTVTGNSATTLGGGVAVPSGTFTMTGGSLSNNTSLNAGGLYNAAATVLDGVTVNANTANGAATTNGGNGGAIYNAASLDVRNATFSGNKAVLDTNASPGISGYGGAIVSFTLSASVAPVVKLTDTSINGGSVSGGNAAIGGALAAYPNTVSGGTTSRIDATRLTLSKNVALAGGGIFTYGTTTLTDGTLDRNQATHASAGYGGGLYATAATGTSPTLTLDSTDVTGNTAQTGGGGLIVGAGVTAEVRYGSTVSGNSAPVGGGAYSSSALTIRASHVDGNSASNSGAGLYSLGATTLVDSTVDNNTAAFLGGGVATATGPFSSTGGHISGNSAFGAGGVFVGDNSPASFDGTDFVGNAATGSGGGAVFNAGSTTITRSSLTGNHAIHTSGNTGLGAAIYSGSNNDNVTTRLTVSSSTISGNDAYAASALLTYSPGTGSTNKASIDDTTITANTSSSAVGAIEQFHPLTITNSTITDNTATGSNAAGALYMFAPSSVGVAGTIVSHNTVNQCSGAVSDGGYNVGDDTEVASSCGFSAAKHDLVFADPQLGALANNGGPTRTRLPGPASPVLDKIATSTATGLSDAVTGAPVSLCVAGSLDQRGTARPQGAKCDIGAVEKGQVAPAVSGPATADASVGAAMAPLTYTSTGSPQATLTATGLPTGVTFTDHGDGTGTVAGTPGAGTGGSYPVTVTAVNEAGTATTPLTLVVHEEPLLSGPATATYTVGQLGGPTTFSQTFGYPNGTLSSVGALPGGVGFTDHGDGTGSYAGTPGPGSGGVYHLTVKDDNGTPPAATAPFALTVDEAPAITGPGSAIFTVGAAGASGEYAGSGFPAPSFTATGLPAGLGIVSTGTGTAKISGTAANGTGGEYDAVLTAANGVGTAATKNVHLTVDEAPELVGPSDARFVVGQSGTIAFSSDGYPQATVSTTGALPSGLAIVDNGNGSATISGTPAAGTEGSYAITVTASNGIDPDAVIHLTLVVAPHLAITSSVLPNGAVGAAYSGIVEATGGQPPYTFTVDSGSLPAGLTMDGSGLITGSPIGPTGTYTFTVKAVDSDDPQEVATKELSITVVKGATTLAVDPVVLQTSGLNVRVGIVKATLTGGFPAQPIAGQTVVFKAGATTVCTGVTGADGKVTCKMDVVPTLLVILNLGVSASYAGNSLWLPASGSAGLIG
jgi:hypothetical protein